MASALHDEGVEQVWSGVEDFVAIMRKEGEFGARRMFQQKHWMWSHIDWQLAQRSVLESTVRHTCILLSCTLHSPPPPSSHLYTHDYIIDIPISPFTRTSFTPYTVEPPNSGHHWDPPICPERLSSFRGYFVQSVYTRVHLVSFVGRLFLFRSVL